LGTNWDRIMFRNAKTQLTLSYTVIITAITLFFSGIIYQIGARIIDRDLHRQHNIINQLHINGPILIPRPDNQIIQSKHELLIKLVILNIAILFFSLIASYFLAKRTLKPIKESLNQQKNFTSDVSHELRTPLTAIRMESEVALLNKKSTKEDLEKTIQSNLEEVDKLEGIISNLLKLSRLEASEIKSSFKNYDLNEITNSAINKIGYLAKIKEIKINNKETNLKVYGDKESIEQLLVIVLDNAIKYSNKKSGVDITYKNSRDGVSIIIEDKGRGINSDDLDHIFDRFYKADKSRTKDQENKGYGLGLSIAKMISDLHDGEIKITSEEGNGTTVEIVLPKNAL